MYLSLDFNLEMDVNAGDYTPKLVTEASNEPSGLNLGFPWTDKE